MRRYFITQGAKTTAGGTVVEGLARYVIDNRSLALEGHHVLCPACETTGVIAAWHEQQNILQPTMYTDQKLIALLRSNHLSYVTGIPSGAAKAIELTLASQCNPVDDGRTIGFSRNPVANLADIDQRMTFVLKAAAQFDELLHSTERHRIEQALEDIAAGRGVR